MVENEAHHGALVAVFRPASVAFPMARQDATHYYIVSDYHPKMTTLMDYVNRDDSLPLSALLDDTQVHVRLRVIRQIAANLVRGMADFHGAGVAHRGF